MPRSATTSTSRWSRAARSASVLTGIGVLVNGLRLRDRAAGLQRLAADPDADVDLNGWTAVTATGVTLHPDTLRQAAAWADAEGLDAIDILPVDLPVARALDLLRQVDTAKFRTDPLAEGRTGGHAIVVRAALAERAELPTGPVSPAGLIDVARHVKRFAPLTTDVAVAADERAVDHDADEQLAAQRSIFDRYSTVNLGTAVAELAVLGAGVAAAPAVGAAAITSLHAQPALVFGGNPAGLAPRDLVSNSIGRWGHEAKRLVGLLRATAPDPTSIRVSDELRPAYAKELAEGTAHLFEPRSSTCPWCEGTDLHVRLTMPDLIQHKPGTFVLDECGSCGHVFQNPRLTIEGLDFYYRDFYDGFAGDEMEKIFASEVNQYGGRAAMVAAHLPQPKRWLDVGGGHGHFCLVAKEHFPETLFECVEQSAAIEEAAHRGWVDQAHRAWFPEIAGELAGRYDVVSMFHYLEHTREPRAELDAAMVVIEPGGLLMIELPDPECPSGRWLGRFWMPWLQPQHQHFLSIDRLEDALRQRSFTVLDRYRAPATAGGDTLAGAWLAAGQVVPRPWMPWLPRPTIVGRVARLAVCLAAVPLGLVAAGANRVRAAFGGDDQPGNAFRVLARYDGAPADPSGS